MEIVRKFGLWLIAAVLLLLAIGLYLDNKVFESSPWLTIIFLILGIAAGFRNIGIAIKKSRKL